MERLTARLLKGDGYYMKCSQTCPYDCQDICECEELDRMINKLGEIEDILGGNYDLNRLRELLEADRDGRCDIHKVKDGETVYSIFAYVNGLHIKKSNGEPFDKIASYIVDDFTRNTVDREYGKTVFLTREAAEAVLKQKNE